MDIVELAERQVRNWQREQTRRRKTKTLPQPTVIVSRQHGTDGVRIARLVAERLDFELWDQRILHEMAEHGGLSEVLLSSLDEKPRNVFLEAFAAINHTCTTTSEYMHELLFQMHLIDRHGNAVILGRGAQFVLDPGRTFRVRLVASREYRARQVAAREQLDNESALARVDSVDGDRAKFIRQQWSRDIDDVLAYDQIVNVERVGPEGIADGIVATYRGRFEV